MTNFVAIVGRPNVGKSTLFNILTNSKSAVVADFSGLTRDRKYGTVRNSTNIVIDTGGIIEDTSDLGMEVRKQTEYAIAESDAIIFMVDAKDGLIPLDQDIARLLRKYEKEIVLVINKVDNSKAQIQANDFSALGFKDPLLISASHRLGTGLLFSYIEQFEDSSKQSPPKASDSITVSLIGRPNAGKSTLINKILGEERVLVSPLAGTTRDSIEIPFNFEGNQYLLIDTAGLRRKRSIKQGLEKSIVTKSIESIKRSNIVVLIIDGSENIVDQDIHLLSLSLGMGKPIIIAANKVDLLKRDEKKLVEETINRKISFAKFIKPHFISAKEGEGVASLLTKIKKLYRSSAIKLDTSLLNHLLQQAVEKQAPPMSGRFRPKLRYVHAIGKNPPKILIHGNNLSGIKSNYKKYLQNFFREKLPIKSSPVEIVFKDQENPYKDKINKLTPKQRIKRKRIIKKAKKK